MLSVAALLNGVDARDAGVARLFERVRDIPFRFAAHRDADTLLALPPEHEDRLLGIARRPSFARAVVPQPNEWLDPRHEAWHSSSAESRAR
jgi:hypothetical protein